MIEEKRVENEMDNGLRGPERREMGKYEVLDSLSTKYNP